MRVTGRTYAAVAALVAMAVVLHVVGSLAGLSLAEWSLWIGTPIGAATGGLRILALALTYYLIGVLVVVMFLGDRAKGHLLERLVPYGMLAALGLLAGVSAMSAANTQMSAVAAADTPGPLTLQTVPDPLTLDPADHDTITSPVIAPVDKDGLHQGQPAQDRWVVTSGESFWAIAEELLQDSWGREDLTDVEIADYWRTLIAANEDRLIDPGNPDLLVPDQELVVPPPPPEPVP